MLSTSTLLVQVLSSLVSLAPAAPEESRRVEVGETSWVASKPHQISRDEWSSDGAAGSLSVVAGENVVIDSEPRKVGAVGSFLRFDVLVPPGANSSDEPGEVDVFIQCESSELEMSKIGTVDLSSVEKGAFYPVYLPFPESLQTRLSEGCQSAVLRLVVNSNERLGTLLFDRFRLSVAVKVNNQPWCGRQMPRLSDAMQLENGLMDFQLWRRSREFVSGLERFHQLVETCTGANIGVATNDLNRSMVAVVDRRQSSHRAMRRLAKLFRSANLPFDVEIRRSCRSQRYFKKALAVLRSPTTFPEGVPAHYVEPWSSKIKVVVAPERVHEVRSKLSRWAGKFSIEVNERRREGRFDDSDPHFGAAAIDVNTSGEECTSGFLVDGILGRGAVTAAHCFILASGEEAYSGTELYGSLAYKDSDPTWDIAYIAPAGETFASRPMIYTDPGAVSTRRVVGATRPRIGQVLCISGRVHRARCGLDVVHFYWGKQQQGNSRFDVFTDLVEARHPSPDFQATGPGTSGAPLYLKSGVRDAIVVGVHVVAGPSNESLFHDATDVLSRLNLTLALK